MNDTHKNILYATFEAAPFAKTGGLGDVGGTLPGFLRAAGTDTRVVMPKHGSIPETYRSRIRHLYHFYIQLAWRWVYCGIETLRHDGVTYYFIDNEQYFKRDRLYGYGDDEERVAFFCKAVLELLTRVYRFKPHVIHCNDWHTALIPVMLKEYFGDHPLYRDIKTVMTIHNLKFQGIMGRYFLGDLLAMEHHMVAREYMAWDGAINFMKGGLHYTDAVTTVSPSYAREITTPYFGEGLDGVLRWRENILGGILNGIDYEAYDPKTDRALARVYTPGDREGKLANKRALQAELGLPVRDDSPLFVMVSRFTEQKGLDLLAHIAETFLSEDDAQVAVLGTGDWRYEEMFYYFAGRYPDKLAARIGFDDGLAHRMYAGGDAFLMPSRFEPCGLSQMIAMRYGTLPVVRETGGLADTVTPYNPETGAGTGFGFANYNAHEFLDAMRRAAALFRENPERWRALQTRAAAADFRWEKSAESYLRLYDKLCGTPPPAGKAAPGGAAKRAAGTEKRGR